MLFPAIEEERMDSSSDSKPNGELQSTPLAEVNQGETPFQDDTGSPDMLSTTSLEALQSTEQRELMDLVDRLRRAGLSSVLQLPQIVVCGDQSSGKSSVLEGITGIPFPRKENMCTRFATEIIMRRDAEPAISCKINPDSSRAEYEQIQLREFSRSIKDFDELPSLIDDATAAMGLGGHKAFGKDVLSIEVCGPNRPQLTLVDLPGLIHAANKSQSEEDVELIRSLVEDYISEKRTIILAVISAKNDYANQVILKNCRKFDPKGARTLGVITKPDYLWPGSENEGTWLDLARNRDVYFELGWHILKNRTDGEHRLSFTERNLKERAFFNAGSYKALPGRIKGIDSLRERLSQLLFHHLKRELPVLKKELDNMESAVRTELQSLGRSRITLSDQRLYLAEILSSAYEIVVMGMNGNYENTFFGGVDIDSSIEEENPRLRAVIQHLNIRFAERMRRHGHKYSIRGNDADDSSTYEKEEAYTDEEEEPEPETAEQQGSGPLKLTRSEAVEQVVEISGRIRGREIAGTFNPMLVSHLFWEQSEGWCALAKVHIDSVAAKSNAFVLHVLDHVAPPEMKPRLLNLIVLPALKRAHNAALSELEHIKEDKQRHPITYNHYFTDTLQKRQQERYSRDVKKLAQDATVEVSELFSRENKRRSYINPEKFEEAIHQTTERDMDKFSAEQALDAHDAYYKAERKYFIDVITKQVIERHLIVPLAKVFAPKAWAGYSDKEIHFLASEPPETVQMREHLEGKSKILQEGQEAFRKAMGQSM